MRLDYEASDGRRVVIECRTFGRQVQNSKRPVHWYGIRVYGSHDQRLQELQTFWEQQHFADSGLPEIREKLTEISGHALPSEDAVLELEGFLDELSMPLPDWCSEEDFRFAPDWNREFGAERR